VRIPARITPYPTGRLFWGYAVPGTSCQVTIAPSLRDISRQAPDHSFTGLFCETDPVIGIEVIAESALDGIKAEAGALWREPFSLFRILVRLDCFD
jgi:hypothetical protein